MKLESDFSSILPFDNIFQGPRFEQLKRTLLSVMLRQKDKLFQTSKDPAGDNWAPLSKKALARRTAKATKAGAKDPTKHKILVDTSRLANSLTSASAPYGVRSTTGEEVKLGTGVEYAAIHNFGGTIELPENRNAFGNGTIVPARSIVIPARPFMGFGGQDETQVQETVSHYMKKESGKNG